MSEARDPRDAVSTTERRRYLDVALALADRSRAVILDHVRRGFGVEVKPDASLVTDADVAAERAVRERAAELTPEAGVVGEELADTGVGNDLVWVVDPIDGTAEFASHMPVYGTIIGLFLDGRPLVGVIDHPELDLRVHAGFGLGAWKGDRRLLLDDLDIAVPDRALRLGLPARIGFTRRSDDGPTFDRVAARFPNFRTLQTCYTHACTALGALDAAMEWNVRPWDLAATRILVEEAGGAYLDLGHFDHPGTGTVCSALFGRPSAVRRVAEAIA
ncbi:MAG: hypothetical protein H6983_10805 [Ectothiorhodospiraceae bacterium]|nr:hypothetical protein [Chromatiales bacterium]MCP5154647.1 hypothetical protein [Ectothiorhodospiraceae bacterium]